MYIPNLNYYFVFKYKGKSIFILKFMANAKKIILVMPRPGQSEKKFEKKLNKKGYFKFICILEHTSTLDYLLNFLLRSISVKYNTYLPISVVNNDEYLTRTL